jgi:hypothetical protein
LIAPLRSWFNDNFRATKYSALQADLADRCGTRVEFRVAETPVFVEQRMLDEMAREGALLAEQLMADAAYLESARKAIPVGYDVAGQTAHPNFLTADFALVRDAQGALAPRLVEIQAFPSVFGFQSVLCFAHQRAYELPESLNFYLSGLDEESYWNLLARTVLGGHDAKHVVLTEVDPQHQKTLPDFHVTAKKLGIAVVDIERLEPNGDKLFYRDKAGALVHIKRIYNRAIADELMVRRVQLPFDLTRRWDVEWAGHPNWYFLISKYSVPWLCRAQKRNTVVPPAVFLDDFLDGRGREELEGVGVPLPPAGPKATYSELLLKPLFGFAGKGIQFEPTQVELEAIPVEQRTGYLLQQRMRFEPTIETPHGMTQAEFRILYLWPDGGELTPALSLVRLGRGKMMGVDHNKNQEWVGASAAFFEPQGSEKQT